MICSLPSELDTLGETTARKLSNTHVHIWYKEPVLNIEQTPPNLGTVSSKENWFSQVAMNLYSSINNLL